MNIALNKAYLCPECSFIGDNASHCEKCLTTNILPLADVLNRTDLNAAGAYHLSSDSSNKKSLC